MNGEALVPGPVQTNGYAPPIALDPPCGKLAAALAKAQASIGTVAKDRTAKVDSRTGRSYTYTYATLAGVWDAIREPLSTNEIAVVQLPSADGHRVTITTKLLHASGESLESSIAALATDASPQAIGSAITYLRRYALVSICGVATDDDDGQAAQPQNRSAPSEISRGAERGLQHMAQTEARREGPAPARQVEPGQAVAALDAHLNRPSNQDRLKAATREQGLPLRAITDLLAEQSWPNPARLSEDQVLEMERVLLPGYARRTNLAQAPQPEVLPDGSRNPEFLSDPEDQADA